MVGDYRSGVGKGVSLGCPCLLEGRGWPGAGDLGLGRGDNNLSFTII